MSSSSNLLQNGNNNQVGVGGAVTPADNWRKAKKDKNLLLSAVSFQMPTKKPASPGGALGNRGLKGYLGKYSSSLRIAK